MAYINDLFELLISDMPYPWVKDWAKNYDAFTKDIQILKERIYENPEADLGEPSFYTGLTTFHSYPSFLLKLLYEKSNGISSRGQSVLSREKLNIAQGNEELRGLIKEMIQSPDTRVFGKFTDWWGRIIVTGNPLLINRAFAACSPKSLTSTVDNGKFHQVRDWLMAEAGMELAGVGRNWLEWNELVTAWLDQQLEPQLSVYEPELARYNWRNIFFWLLYEYSPAAFEIKKQLVKYGAPGTGKTFSCKRDVRNHFTLWKGLYHRGFKGLLEEHMSIVQFHPSFTYEDFMEGIRPVVVAEGKVELRLLNGVFKLFCLKASSWEMDLYRQIPDLKVKNWEEITVSHVKGKVAGARWDFLNDIKDPDQTLLDKVIPPFYIIIDEINRAELSRVLGELMYCLEYRGYNGKIKTQYSSMVDGASSDGAYWYENGENYFFIPHNVYILCTMNNIDRSVESFDFALRRRFQWVEVGPDYDVIINDKLPEKLLPMVDSLRELNDRISKDPLLGNDYRIGHSYLMKRSKMVDNLDLIRAKEHLWVQNILPLLEEYLRGSGENSRLKEFETAFLK